MSLRDKVVVVTGGSRGIGRAIVLGAVERGARVAFCARGLGGEAEETLALARRLGGEARAWAADVSREPDVDALFDAVIDAWDRVDVVVNNAGINRDDLLVRTSADAFDAVLATNLTGAFLVSRRAALEMLAQGDGGRIVSIGSLSQRGATSQAAYAASKGGLVGLTRTLAKELGHKGITANLVIAGLVETELSARLPDALRQQLVESAPLRRAGTPEEVAAVALWLASDGARYVNGASIHASGGLVDVSR